MARKHSTTSKGQKTRPRAFNPKDSSLNRWEKLSDIPLDEEDRYHASRDQILLNGEDDEYLDEGDEDEVFALKGVAEDSEDGDSEGDEEVEDQDSNEDSDTVAQSKIVTKKISKTKGKKAKPSPPSSQASESEEEEGWGKKKSDYYSSNAAQLESDDEEANELEEQEAKKLQAKVRDTLGEDDFGLGDAVEDAPEPEEDLFEPGEHVVEPSFHDKQSLLRHLEKTNPEALALARDWDDIARSLVKSQAKIAAMEVADPDVLSLGLVHLHYQALLTYATTLAFYLNLRSSAKYTARPDLLRTHPIMSRLYRLKQSLTTLEELDFASSDSDEEEDDEDADAFNLWNLDKMGGLDLDELRDLLADAGDNLTDLDSLPKPKGNSEPRLKIKIRGKGQTTVLAEGEDAGSTTADGPLKKKRKKANLKSKHGSTDPNLPQFDLEEPTFPSTSKSKFTASNVEPSPKSVSLDPSYDPYGEHITLQQSDAQDKASRRRSLRFHTSKIESSSTKREKARASMGGDDDIPWKERKRVREDRLKREAEKKRGMGGDDLDDTEPEARGGIDEQEGAKKRKRNEEDGASDGSDGEGNDGGYYDLVKRQSKEKKEKKKVEYEAVQASLRAQVEVDETTDGPRSLTRAILKNKGLTPHRSKSIRNPRVKKRQRFEKAKKKVSSQKATYKGGISETGKYDGERSGISKVIKSVRL